MGSRLLLCNAGRYTLENTLVAASTPNAILILSKYGYSDWKQFYGMKDSEFIIWLFFKIKFENCFVLIILNPVWR